MASVSGGGENQKNSTRPRLMISAVTDLRKNKRIRVGGLMKKTMLVQLILAALD
jgi:hypothetical protein